MQLAEKDRSALLTHLRDHQSYPANKSEIVGSWNTMMRPPKDALDWFEKALPERTYTNAEEVIQAAGLDGKEARS